MSSGVEFDEDKIAYGAQQHRYPNMMPQSGGGYMPASNERGMAGWLVRKGWAKTHGAAQGILIVLIIVNIIVTYIVISYFL